MKVYLLSQIRKGENGTDTVLPVMVTYEAISSTEKIHVDEIEVSDSATEICVIYQIAYGTGMYGNIVVVNEDRKEAYLELRKMTNVCMIDKFTSPADATIRGISNDRKIPRQYEKYHVKASLIKKFDNTLINDDIILYHTNDVIH